MENSVYVEPKRTQVLLLKKKKGGGGGGGGVMGLAPTLCSASCLLSLQQHEAVLWLLIS